MRIDRVYKMSELYPEFRVCNSKDEIHAVLGGMIADAAEAAIRERGVFLLATSGGSFPSVLSSALSGVTSSGRDLQCEKWVLCYADERHVALDDADSNHRATAAAFCAADAARAWWRPRAVLTIDASLPLGACAEAYERELRAHLPAAGGALDLVLLGMGPDGHTASLFPGHALLAQTHGGAALVAPISDSPKPPAARVTLTLPAIRAARGVVFVAAGAEKAAPLARIQTVDAAASDALEHALPAARCHAAGKSAVFIVDQPAAASLLHKDQ
jgi:6-phosphogluconolactonase